MDPARCHNKRQMRSRCTACQDIRPQALYQKPGFVPRFNACANCGLCVSACTTRCISPAPDTLEAQAALLKKPEGPGHGWAAMPPPGRTICRTPSWLHCPGSIWPPYPGGGR